MVYRHDHYHHHEYTNSTLPYPCLHIPSVMELKSFFGRPVDDGVAKQSLSDRVRTSIDPAAAGGLNSIRLFLCCVVDKWDR